MSIKIHHGPPGSYKTASAVEFDLLEAIKRGDVIITNVRGLTLEKIHNEFDDVPETVDVIFLDLDNTEDREKIKRFFHWAPKNATFIWDEAAVCFPKSMRPAEIDGLRYKTPTEAAQEGRPHTWEEAWDMHRHYGWNVILCLVNIKKLRDDIRGAAEMALKHKNQAILGSFFKGKFLQAWHSADTVGNPADFYQVSKLKMKKDAKCWRLYESTKTNEIKDTTAGFNIFKSPKLVFLSVCVLLAVLFLFRDGTPEVLPSQVASNRVQNDKESDNLVIQPQTSQEVSKPVRQDISSPVRNVVSYARSLTRLAPIDIVKRVREEPILTGCVSNNDKCICYTHNGVKLDLQRTYCELIQKSGFYSEKPIQVQNNQDQGFIDGIKNKVDDFVTPSTNSLSVSSLDELRQRDAQKEQRYNELVSTRVQSESRKGSSVTVYANN